MAAELLLDFAPVLLPPPAGRPRPPTLVYEQAPVATPWVAPAPARRPRLAALRHFFQTLMRLPQLQRDLREVENELRFARTRLAHYETLAEQELATDCRYVVRGHEQLRDTLTARIQSLTNANATKS